MSYLGLIHVYTGDGKGKTTAAVGLAVRALGSGLRVCYCSFHKDPEKYGYSEIDSLRKLGATVKNFAKGHPHLDKTIDEEEIKHEVNQAIRCLTEIVEREHYDLLIIDEILISVRDNYLDEALLLDFIDHKPYSTELVLTGRCATEALMQRADYITFCKNMKHPYERGVESRKGIEF